MDNQKFIDSTYGSFSGFISSNSSSYSMSLSDSEFPEEPPSTSGCSSDFAHSTTQKDKRKERLKQYLRQLKQIVNPAAQSGAHVSTLGALRHVINSIQKNKEDDKNVSSERCISICSTSESEVEMNILSLKAVDDLQILVSTKGMKIVQVSPSLKKILGYPVDSWIGRELTSFLHRKDVVTVNSSYVLDDPDKFDTNFSIKFDEDGNATSEAPKKVLYCRLRHYKSLKSGFNLEKKDQYTSFQASASTKKFNSDKVKPKQFLLLECQPLNSAYNKNWSEMSTEKKTFGTRHSLFCSYTYIHPNAIPLLGYLPQDMVGMSIFDFYHPEEFEQLYNIYRQVVTSKGTTISSPKIRFRTQNGDWIYVKTEWSSFINPWSKRLEFIIGQHTVIKGPQNIDVFSPPPRQECIAEEPEQYHKNLRLIRKLLLQPVVDEAKSVALNIVEESTEEVSVSPTPDGDKDMKEETSIKTQEAKKKFQSATRNEQRNEILNDNLSGTYEQLSYTNNIKRFLMSQPKTYSSSSHKSSGNDSYSDNSNAIDSDEVPDFGVDISYPKPPSFCSSTKVLVSEKEDMVPSPSCQIEEIVEETSREAQIIFSAIQEPNVLMSLTQETLQEHTKRQEKIYLEQAKQDSNLVLLNMTSKYSVQQESSQGLKRGHSSDLDETRRFKSFKAEDVNLLCPPFPMTTTGPVMKPSGGQPKIAFPNMYGIGLTQSTGAMYHGGSMPGIQLPQQPPITNGNPGNIQWPYYPQSGSSFYPQVMGGFYQPMTVLSYPMPLWTGGVATTKHKAIFTQAGDKGNTAMSISDSSSGENTSSSLMYLLELSNNQEIAKAKESKASATATKKRHSDPPWLFGVLWVEGVQMRYTLPRRKFNRTMKEDRDALKLMKQSDVVLKQMEELKENIEKSCQEPTEDEEADYLFMIDPDLFKDDSSSDSQEIEASEKLRCSLKSFSESKTTDETITKAGNGDDNSLSETQYSLVGDEMDDQEKKSESECDSLPKSGYNDSSVDMESASYKSSDLTPSDSRSTDDKGSSMKESDTQSFKLSEGNKDSESENDLNQTQNLDSQFDHLFVKNPTKFKHSKKGFWIKEANMNERIKMEYTLKNNSRKDVLLDDLNRLNEMNQSAVVQNQLSYLLEDLKTEEQKITCSFCESLEEMSSNTKCSNCAKEQNMKKMNANFFDSLFMQPLFPQDTHEAYLSEHPIRDSPDMEDLCDIIDAVD